MKVQHLLLVCTLSLMLLVGLFAVLWVSAAFPEGGAALVTDTIPFAVASPFGTPNGAVNVPVEGETENCTGTITDGMNPCSLALQTPRTSLLNAIYPADGSSLPSIDLNTHNVAEGEVVTIITSDEPDPSFTWQPFTVTFAVTSPFGIPRGYVVVEVSDSDETCSSELTGNVGSCNLVLTKSGTYTLTASYLSDESFMGGIDTEPHRVDNFKEYLPFVGKSSLSSLVDVVETYYRIYDGYPTTWVIYGYVENRISNPIYGVAVGIDITIYPYCDPPYDCDPIDDTDLVDTAFYATLPGQINPFAWDYTLGKAYLVVTDVRVANVDQHNQSGFYYKPLTIVQWGCEDSTVSGTVRNDDDQVLLGGRVVVFAEKHYWKKTNISKTALQPGEEADFSLSYPCESEGLIVLGQGKVDLDNVSENSNGEEKISR